MVTWKRVKRQAKIHWHMQYVTSDLFNPLTDKDNVKFDVIRKMFVAHFKKDILWHYRSKRYTMIWCIRIWNCFLEMMLTDLINRHDEFLFPLPSFGAMRIGATEKSWNRNYVNFETAHKKIEVIIKLFFLGKRIVRYRYRVMLRGNLKKLLDNRMYIDKFHFDDY